MDLLQTVLNAQGGAAVDELARSLGLGKGETISAVEQLLPALAAGLQRNATNPSGLDGLMGALAGGRHQQYLDNPSTLDAPATIADGNGILGHILGSKDVSRDVAARASAQTGISADVLKRMLPLLATLAMGALSKGTAASRGTASGGDAGIFGMLGPLLDSNRNGSMADDVIGMLGKFLK
jgi:hypothetical protein